MSGYTPVFNSILQSTVWECRPHVKVVWFTMMLLSDKHGIIEGSIPGLARASVVTIDECKDALAVLMAPDDYSRTKDHGGRRIVEIDGGWRLLNHGVYKKKLGALTASSRERVARHRERQNDVTLQALHCNDSPLHVTDCNHQDQDQSQDQNQKEPEIIDCPPIAQKRKRRVETEPPEFLAISIATESLANKLGRVVESDWFECRDWYLSKGKRMVDWNATLRTWMKKSIEYSREKQSTCPDRIQFTQQHHDLCKRGSLNINDVWTESKNRYRSNGQVSCDWQAAFTATLMRRIENLERDAATRANGPPSTKTPPVTRPERSGATVGQPKPGTPPSANPEPRRDMSKVLSKFGGPDA